VRRLLHALLLPVLRCERAVAAAAAGVAAGAACTGAVPLLWLLFEIDGVDVIEGFKLSGEASTTGRPLPPPKKKEQSCPHNTALTLVSWRGW